MNMTFAAALLFSSVASASGSAPPAVSAGNPVSLTGWRTSQGVFLSWSSTPQGVSQIWRGTYPGGVSRMATIPGNQPGFLDLSAVSGQEYYYALGAGSRPGPLLHIPGRGGAVKIMAGLVTTCSGLAPGGVFPANNQNVFLRSQNPHVQFYGLYVMKPFDPGVREVRIVWTDPKGRVFSRYSHSITPRRIELPDGPAGQIVAPQAIGLQQVVAQNGQESVPEEPGMYTVEVFIDDVPASLAIFYLKEEPAQQKAPAQ
jgi:hypothetical protein